MRILMLGNSYTYFNDLPDMLAELTGAEVVAHTRGGARLAEQLNPDTGMGEKTGKALQEENWDYVVLQEMSNGAITEKKSFQSSVAALCGKIRANGAVPVLYATWAYQKGGKQLAHFGMGYEEMEEALYASFHETADQNAMLIADVGRAFYEHSEKGEDLYSREDGSHPNEAGSRLAAQTIARVILEHAGPAANGE